MERHALAAERRSIFKEPSSDKRRVLELALSRKVITPTSLDRECALAQTRWVAYAYMTPLACTELFCRLYLATYRHHYAQHRNGLSADEQLPVDPELIKNDPDEISSFWHARQMADEIGMPYDMYLNVAMSWATSQRNRKHFPRPNQLYGQQQLDAAKEKWGHEKAIVTLFDEEWDDRFFKQNPVRDPPRTKALLMAFAKLKRSGSPALSLANLMGSSDALSEPEANRVATRLFPNQPEMLDDAKRHLMPPRAIRTTTAFDVYRPPCVGMRQDVTTGPCSQCNLTLFCQKARLVSDKLLQAQTGSSDPIADKKRELARDRQRRKRDKDRAARGEPDPAVATG